MVRLGFVVASFSGDLVDDMVDRAREAATERGASVVAEREVPGAYDAPLAADRLARRGDVDAVVVIGAIISGDTDHDHVIAEAAATGLTDVSLDRDTPVTFGVTGPGMSLAEARERVDYGVRAVDAAIDLVGAP
ncbi:MAG: 6,7-dimethyl-8-ribityllumazine synthase [Halobacteriaceae archaeon]